MGKVIPIGVANNNNAASLLYDDDDWALGCFSEPTTDTERAIAATTGGVDAVADAIADYRREIEMRQFALIDQMFELLASSDAPLDTKEQAVQLYKRACGAKGGDNV